MRMQTHAIQSEETKLGAPAVLVHLGIALFGVTALLTGGIAEADDDCEYQELFALGYAIHGTLGLGGAFFLSLRLVLGLCGPRQLRFSRWVPYTRERLLPVFEDIRGLLRFRLPERPPHTGLAALVQSFGLLAFLLTAASGVLLFLIGPVGEEHMLGHAVKEFHEGAVFLVLFFLSLHVGATLAHALHGRHLWRPMLFLKTGGETSLREPAAAAAHQR